MKDYIVSRKNLKEVIQKLVIDRYIDEETNAEEFTDLFISHLQSAKLRDAKEKVIKPEGPNNWGY